MSVVTSADRPLRRARMPEVELAWRGSAFALALAVPVVAVCGVLRGMPGVLGGLLSAGLVVGLFGLTGVVLACVARRSPARLPAVSLVGALVRMIAYGVILMALAGADGIDRGSTVVATSLLLFATLIFEARFAARAPGFYWVTTPAPHGAPAKERTRR